MPQLDCPFRTGNPVPTARSTIGACLSAALHPAYAAEESSALVGEPRMGKTSLLHYLEHNLEQDELYGTNHVSLRFSFIDSQALGSNFTPAQVWTQALAPIHTNWWRETRTAILPNNTIWLRPTISATLIWKCCWSFSTSGIGAACPAAGRVRPVDPPSGPQQRRVFRGHPRPGHPQPGAGSGHRQPSASGPAARGHPAPQPHWLPLLQQLCRVRHDSDFADIM